MAEFTEQLFVLRQSCNPSPQPAELPPQSSEFRRAGRRPPRLDDANRCMMPICVPELQTVMDYRLGSSVIASQGGRSTTVPCPSG